MAKHTKSPKQEPAKPSGAGLFAARSGIDPTLSALFSTSAGPVKREDRKSQNAGKHDKPAAGSKGVEKSDDEESNGNEDDEEEDDEELSELDDEELDEDDAEDEDEEESEDEKDALLDGEAVGVVDGEVEMAQPDDTIADIEESSRKRKRNRNNDDLEDVYMQKLAKEEAKEEAQRDAERKAKRTKVDPAANATGMPDDDDYIPPQHESLAPTTSSEATSLEQAARTVFLGNVSSCAITSKSAKKTLMTHLSSFLATFPTTAAANDTPHKLESLRFRSVAFSSSVPKKAAFARKDIMDSTTKSTNAYAVYSTKTASREAALRLNGTVVLDRHLRVDEVAHPSQTDHRRCVFVGNLGFVDDASAMDAGMAEADGQKRKPKKGPPGDVEEGLWREFGKVGKVESVRVVRDAKTRVGKGFAYVQFEVSNYAVSVTKLIRNYTDSVAKRTPTQSKQRFFTTIRNSHPSFHAPSVSCAPRNPQSRARRRTSTRSKTALPATANLAAMQAQNLQPSNHQWRDGRRSC